MKNNINILVIDDSKEILFAISAICEYQNWIPITALNGEDGIVKFKKNMPNLVLVDFHMPKMNGIQVVKKLRDISRTIPIVVLTVEERQEIADQFMEVGASDFALKPIKAPDLISRIKVHLRLNQNHEQSKNSEMEYVKGINNSTLELIMQDLIKIEEYTTITRISQGTGLAYQTVHRYLQHLIDCRKVEVKLDYGKRGRPKQSYKWIR